MPDSNIIQIDQNLFETKLDRLVTEKMTQILNAMLDAEADEITGAARYERKEGRKAYRAGHYERTLTAKAGRLELRVPKLKGAVFESAVIERYRRRESSVEEALMEMYLAGVSTRQVDDISKLLWGDRMPSQTLSDKLKRVYDDIDPVRMVPSTRRPCHKITAVQMPQNSRNRASTTSYTPAVHTQPQLRTKAIPTRRGTSSGFS